MFEKHRFYWNFYRFHTDVQTKTGPDPSLFKSRIRIRTFSKAASGSELSQKLNLDPTIESNHLKKDEFEELIKHVDLKQCFTKYQGVYATALQAIAILVIYTYNTSYPTHTTHQRCTYQWYQIGVIW